MRTVFEVHSGNTSTVCASVTEIFINDEGDLQLNDHWDNGETIELVFDVSRVPALLAAIAGALASVTDNVIV